MTLDDGSESGKRQGSFLFCLPSRGRFWKKRWAEWQAPPIWHLWQLGENCIYCKTAAVAVPNATAAVFLRYKDSASSKAREEAEKRDLVGLLTCVSNDGLSAFSE
jgi:hypothetical protein